MFVLFAAAGSAQSFPTLTQKVLVPGGPPMERKERPNAPEKQAEILVTDDQKNLEDVAMIQQLAKEIEQALKEPANSQPSADSIKKSDEIEKLAKRMKARLRRADRK